MPYGANGKGYRSARKEWDPTIVSAKDRMIARQNAINAASALVSAMVTAGLIGSVDESLEKFNEVVEDVFADNLAAAGDGAKAPSVAAVQAIETQLGGVPVSSVDSTTVAPIARSTSGDGAGSIEVKFGKYKGQTIEEIYVNDADYVDFLTRSNNEFVAKKATEFLTNIGVLQ